MSSLVRSLHCVSDITWIVPVIEETRTHRRFAEEVRRHTNDQVLFFRAEAHNVAFHTGRPLAPRSLRSDL